MKGLRGPGNRKGFTLVELLVVVTIISILAGVVGFNSLRHLHKARQSKAKAQIASFKGALGGFYTDVGRYPTEQEGGLNALVEKPLSEEADGWDGPYMDKIPKGPWKGEYEYRLHDDGESFDIICLGKDRKEGGEGVNTDITNHNLDEI